ncbi:hypothetical protein [Streptomyces sp. NPDC054797]
MLRPPRRRIVGAGPYRRRPARGSDDGGHGTARCPGGAGDGGARPLLRRDGDGGVGGGGEVLDAEALRLIIDVARAEEYEVIDLREFLAAAPARR